MGNLQIKLKMMDYVIRILERKEDQKGKFYLDPIPSLRQLFESLKKEL